MADDEPPARMWDEYDWERFLQQQDRKTERYMELLEKYIDDPNRDQIIACEMGWHHLLNDEEMEDIDSQFSEEMKSLAAEEDMDLDAEAEAFEAHPLYQASFALTVWLDQFFDDNGDLQNHPTAVKLATQCAIASAKLAAALSDDDVDEIGMTIAYLKRALKAVTNAIDAGAQLKKEINLSTARCASLNHRLFQIRDRIIALMGEYRCEWRRRQG